MANIAKLPNGSTLLATATFPYSGKEYGPHCTVAVIPSDSVSLYNSTGAHLLTLRVNGSKDVSLGSLDPITMPYANRLLSGGADVLIKDWRTGNYRVKSSKRRASKAARHTATVPTVEVQPSAEVQHMVTESQPKAATITVAPETSPKESPVALTAVGPTDRIPGMEYFSESPKGKLKGAGRGWTDVDGIVLRTEDYQTLNRSWQLRQQGKLGAVLVTGPAGTAKTMLVRAFAHSLGVDFLKVDCSAIRTADDWSGAFRQDPNTKTWAHQWSPFAKALRAGRPCIILLDELTRTESPAALNALLGLFDESGTLLVTDANTVLRLPKGVMVVATANIGPEFVGTLPLDGAVRQRFGRGVRMEYPTEAIEAKLLVDRCGVTRETADALVRMAVQQRMHRDDAQLYPSGNVVSTRLLLGMAEGISYGDPDRDAVWSVLKGQFDPADFPALTVVVDTQFPKNPVPSAPTTEAQPATIVAERHWFTQAPYGANCGYTMSDSSQCNRDSSDPIHFGTNP